MLRYKATAALLALALALSACGGQPAATSPTPPPQTPPSTAQPSPAPATGTQTSPATGSPVTTPVVSTPTQTTPAPPIPAEKPPEPPKPVKVALPKPFRGIHLSGWVAGSPSILNELLAWGKTAGVNAVVLEIKAEDGRVSWVSDVPLAGEIGANTRKVGDIEKLIRELHEAGFWVAGRIVVMNDQYLYKARPAWAIPGFSGGAYSFMDPKNEKVWQYNVDLAKAAAKVGFDEIQFDYIRYPEKLVEGYNKGTTAEARTAAINGFLKYAVSELKPLGLVISADVFGLTTSVPDGDDMEIGQDYHQIAEVVDYISAMVYPSHYAPNTYGIANPDASPYETVKQSMGKALERTPSIPVEKHRPWIQDFTYPTAGAHPYGKAEVLAQVKALKELGIDSFMLWDPANKYTRGLDFRKVTAE